MLIAQLSLPMLKAYLRVRQNLFFSVHASYWITGSGLEDCIVHGNNGLLIRDRSAEYLATTISEFLVMQAKGTFDKSDIASRARSLWHPEHIASRYASLYQDVLLNHG